MAAELAGGRAETGAARARGMTRGRMLAAHLAVLVVLAGHALSVAFEIELWPFSHYPMYATVRRDYALTRPILYAVLADGSEVPLRTLPAFADDRAGAQVARTYERDDDLPRLRPALADLLARYEAGRGDGRPIRALRLYRATWALVPGEAEGDRPEDAELLLEVPGARGVTP